LLLLLLLPLLPPSPLPLPHRISIREIQQHSWFTKPLPQHYQEAIDHMLEEQRRINFQVGTAAQGL
jgi:hypothetical protein